jgi:transcriptional regulator ATRX
MENKARQMDPTKAKRSNILFSDFQNLQRIWTHPRVLRYNSDRFEQSQAKKLGEMEDSDDSEGSLKEFIDDDDESGEVLAN